MCSSSVASESIAATDRGVGSSLYSSEGLDTTPEVDSGPCGSSDGSVTCWQPPRSGDFGGIVVESKISSNSGAFFGALSDSRSFAGERRNPGSSESCLRKDWF